LAQWFLEKIFKEAIEANLTRCVMKHKCPRTRQIPEVAIIVKTQCQDVKIYGSNIKVLILKSKGTCILFQQKNLRVFCKFVDQFPTFILETPNKRDYRWILSLVCSLFNFWNFWGFSAKKYSWQEVCLTISNSIQGWWHNQHSYVCHGI
jgi:hypothetical protein